LHAPAPSHAPVAPQLAAPASWQVPLGSTPFAGTGLHVPGDDATAHDMHVPVHVVRQQTPCAHVPVAHSLPSPHGAPGALRPHEPALQTEGATQSALAVHVALHAEAPHWYGAHAMAAGVTQAPAPSQVDAGVNVAPLAGHVAPPHGVPCGYFWHPPAAHMPLVPHVEVPCATHVPDGSGAPVGTSAHWPMVAAIAHERQAPAHAVAQQTPCAQKPDPHSAACEQNAPAGFVPQLPAAQVFGATQLVLSRQDV